jgi:acyl-CoA thioester hydrolase
MTPGSRNGRRSLTFFERIADAPTPLSIEVKRRVLFSDADPMGVLWHGRYPSFFETAACELHRACGLGYADFHDARLRSPIVELHVDYLRSLYLDQEVSVRATLVWNEAARVNTEYALFKPNGELAAKGYTVQLFTTFSGEPVVAIPELLRRCQARWKAGELGALQ